MILSAGQRLRAVLVALVLAVGLTAGPATAREADRADHVQVRLAVEEAPGESSTELPGPEPNFENTFAPEEFEAPWTWWLGVVLTAVAVLAIGGVGLGYWLLVRRRDES